MIPARRRGFLTALADRYVRGKVCGAFRGLWLTGELPSAEAGSLLAYANHTNFWDGFVVHQLGRASGRQPFAMMEEPNLRRYPFLSWIGAFSIRRGDPSSAMESLRYAQRLLKEPTSAVFVYPEGALRPFGGELELERGIVLLGRRAKSAMVPVGIRYAFFEHERPDILVSVGEPHGPEDLGSLTRRLELQIEKLTAATSTEGFRCVISGKRGVAQRWDSARRMLPSP